MNNLIYKKKKTKENNIKKILKSININFNIFFYFSKINFIYCFNIFFIKHNYLSSIYLIIFKIY